MGSEYQGTSRGGPPNGDSRTPGFEGADESGLFDRVRTYIDASLERERLFREDFSRQLIAELHQYIDASLERERLFREDFSGRMMVGLHEHLDARVARWFGLHMPMAIPAGARIFMHTSDGQRVFLDPSEEFISLHMLEHTEWETSVRDVLRSILRPGGCFVDVGANIGLHTLFATTLVGQTGRVIALEPHPVTCRLLRENLEINGLLARVEVVEAAAAETHGGTRRFEYFPQHSSMSAFRVAPSRVAKFRGTPEAIDVPVVSLDRMLGEREVTPDLVKIDVEGFEMGVLEGALELIASGQDTAILMEYGPHPMVAELQPEGRPPELADFFDDGFEVFKIAESGCIRLSIDTARLQHGNFLFIRRSSRFLEGILALQAATPAV